ncbi:MAG: serine hydrolase, partial [Chloroflexi bacterium]|nr:serine hydrolase [Chloroflexota bacterium]
MILFCVMWTFHFRVAFLFRIILAMTAALGLLAIAWQRHPGPPQEAAPSASLLGLAGTPPAQYILPAPPEPAPQLLRLDAPERPDTPGELAPAAARPPGLLETAAPHRISNSPAPQVGAAAYLVMDEGSGQVLFSLHGHQRRAPASVTKIMTALLAVQHGKLDEKITVDVLGADIPDSTLVYLVPGDKVTMRDLLYGLMLHSGNDCAVQIAHSILGSEAAFVELMNRRAASLGLLDTQYANPHGLDHEGHFA